jgi:hypothetical protein
MVLSDSEIQELRGLISCRCNWCILRLLKSVRSSGVKHPDLKFSVSEIDAIIATVDLSIEALLELRGS